MKVSQKTAVILFNLGGPDCLDSVQPFLLNFFLDKNIIRAPKFVRWLLAHWIALRRSRCEAKSSYAALGGKSPLLENTKAQADALQNYLGDLAQVFVVMRYWHPMAEEVVLQVKDFEPDLVVLLPLYPQYSTTTTRSSVEAWQEACQKNGFFVPTALLCCYAGEDGFVEASAELVRKAYDEALALSKAQGLNSPRVLFSAHGLPEKIIADGDPYQWQCEESARLIAAKTGIEGLDWQICYQSRVGRLKWIRPSTEDALKQAGEDRVPVLIYPHAFVSEHVETLVEIEQEYREKAQHFGVPYFARVSTVGTSPRFIEGLGKLVNRTISLPCGVVPCEGTKCPSKFSQCACAEFSAMSSPKRHPKNEV